MKQRGLGYVYQRKVKDQKTGVVKTLPVWWVQVRWRGKRYRESSGSLVRMDAVKLLRRRLAEMGAGQAPSYDLEKTTFADLEQFIKDDYLANQRRSVKRLTTSLKPLKAAFGQARACDITLGRLNRYVRDRLAAGRAPGTIKVELTHLQKAFHLAEREGKAVCPPFPKINVKNRRTGFFEPSDFQAVLAHLPAAFRAPMEFAHETGWRTPSEVLTLRWTQVDFGAGTVRLEGHMTKSGEPRTFPFTALPELHRLLQRQWDAAQQLHLSTGQSIPTVFYWNDRGTIKPIHPKALYRRWHEACRLAGVPAKIPHDLRRTVVRRFERAGMARSVAMALTGHLTERVYQDYDIVDEKDLSEGLQRVAAHELARTDKYVARDFSHTLATLPASIPRITRETMAEGARFELADPLRGLQFSRLARSATPSPLRTGEHSHWSIVIG